MIKTKQLRAGRFGGARGAIALGLAVFLLVSCTEENDFRKRFERASAKEDRGQHWLAIDAYRDILRSELVTSDRINVLFRLGDCCRKVGSYTMAEDAYWIVAEDYSKEIYLELAFGRLVDCYREAGRYRDALRVYPRLIAITQESILLANVYFDLGRIYSKLSNRRASRRSFHRAIDLCRQVQKTHAGGDFASYASQIEEEVRQVMAKLD
jgi:tetratricopeptide (TPR) repeat protein